MDQGNSQLRWVKVILKWFALWCFLVAFPLVVWQLPPWVVCLIPSMAGAILPSLAIWQFCTDRQAYIERLARRKQELTLRRKLFIIFFVFPFFAVYGLLILMHRLGNAHVAIALWIMCGCLCFAYCIAELREQFWTQLNQENVDTF